MPRLRLGVLAALVAFVALGIVALQLATGSPGAVAGPNCNPSGAAIDSEEQQMLQLINDHRADNNLPPLQLSSTLNKSASWKSEHMANLNYFAHDDTPINRTWVQRIRDCGYTYNTWIGENIAAGNSSAQATFDQWRNSPGHNANMLNTNYTVIGIGRAYNSSATYDWYWTTDFGGYDDGYTPAETPTPAATPTPAPAPVPGVRAATGPDADGDGCADARELGSDPGTGGQRDPNNYWDFFDTPTQGNVYDGVIDLTDDVFNVVFRFGATDEGGTAAINRYTNPLSAPSPVGTYHPAFDRSPAPPGAPAWEMGPPDGVIDLLSDVFGAALQFGHSCR